MNAAFSFHSKSPENKGFIAVLATTPSLLMMLAVTLIRTKDTVYFRLKVSPSPMVLGLFNIAVICDDFFLRSPCCTLTLYTARKSVPRFLLTVILYGELNDHHGFNFHFQHIKSLFSGFYNEQEPTWSLQLYCVGATAFSQVRLFLD